MPSAQLKHPKPEPRARTKGRKTRAESKAKRGVRAQCAVRDGYCRVWSLEALLREVLLDDQHAMSLEDMLHQGVSEWAHLSGHRRSQTRGMAPETRHRTATSLMMCQRHHQLEERGILRVEPLTDKGCDGPLRFSVQR